jgi:N-methylhydantoinase A
MIEIGSGGGSIARVDSRGLIAVGPTSASSVPGPACYDLSGTSATLTDANLVLGFLDEDYFLGGRMRLKPDLARIAIDRVRAQIGLSNIETTAEGIREIAAEDVAAAFRTHAAELGLDVRRSTLVAFGGSGPVMATLVARKLHIKSVLFPAGSGVFSAIGLLASPASFEVTRTFRARLKQLGDDEINKLFVQLSDEAARALVGMKVRPEDIAFEQLLELRYVGQGHQVRIALPDRPGAGRWGDSILRRFEQEYTRTFSINAPESEVEVTDWRVVATEKHAHAAATAVVPSVSNGVRVETTGSFWTASKWSKCRKISRYDLKPTDVIHGPALIQEVESTCVLLPGDIGTVLPSGHIQVEIPDGELRL